MTRLKWGTLARLGPGFWAWARWRDGGRKGPRPNVSWSIPTWAWARYDLHRGVKPPPPPVQAPPSVFAGVGLFTASDPMVCVRELRGLADWVAVQAEGQTDGKPWATPEIVRELRAAGFDVHVWEARSQEGQAAVERLGATGWIGQAESWPELRASLLVGENVRAPKALIGNPAAVADRPDAWPFGYAPIIECYWNANPQATPEAQNYEAYKRGARRISLCYGTYDASAEQPGVGRRVPLWSYLVAGKTLGLAGFSCYLAETLTPDDIAVLRERR